MQDLTTLQQLINKYTLIKRRHYIPGTDMREDDSSHSLSVAVMCWYYYDKLKPKLRMEKVLKYALIHDLVEIYAGDVMAYASSAALKQKVIDERKALKRLAAELAFAPNLVGYLTDYQNHSDSESEFVWMCDKIQSYVQGMADNWRAYVEGGITDEMFVSKLAEHAQKGPAFMQSEFEQLSQQWTESFLDR